jgi:hypothetical protein
MRIKALRWRADRVAQFLEPCRRLDVVVQDSLARLWTRRITSDSRTAFNQAERLLSQDAGGKRDGKPRVPAQNFAGMSTGGHRATVEIVGVVNISEVRERVSHSDKLP